MADGSAGQGGGAGLSDFTIDVSEVTGFVDSVGRVVASATREVDAVVKKGAQNVKNEMVADASASPHFKGMAGSISYDQLSPGEYEVGPDKGRRGGALGNIYYFGTSRGGGSGDIDKPVQSETPRFEQALTALVAEFGGRL